MKRTVNILSTKKLKAGLVQQALEEGFLIQDIDFITIQFTAFPTDIPGNTLVFTSAHAVAAFAQNNGNRFYKAYCLQGATMEALAGMPNIAILGSAANAQLLAALIVKEGHVKNVTFICGHQRRGELPDYLKVNGINVQEIKVYETLQTSQQVTTPYEAILFFSPSGVDSFFQRNVLSPEVVCACIGETTAAALRAYSNNEIIIAPLPTQEAVVNCVKALFKNNKSIE